MFPVLRKMCMYTNHSNNVINQMNVHIKQFLKKSSFLFAYTYFLFFSVSLSASFLLAFNLFCPLPSESSVLLPFGF